MAIKNSGVSKADILTALQSMKIAEGMNTNSWGTSNKWHLERSVNSDGVEDSSEGVVNFAARIGRYVVEYDVMLAETDFQISLNLLQWFVNIFINFFRSLFRPKTNVLKRLLHKSTKYYLTDKIFIEMYDAKIVRDNNGNQIINTSEGPVNVAVDLKSIDEPSKSIVKLITSRQNLGQSKVTEHIHIEYQSDGLEKIQTTTNPTLEIQFYSSPETANFGLGLPKITLSESLIYAQGCLIGFIGNIAVYLSLSADSGSVLDCKFRRYFFHVNNKMVEAEYRYDSISASVKRAILIDGAVVKTVENELTAKGKFTIEIPIKTGVSIKYNVDVERYPIDADIDCPEFISLISNDIKITQDPDSKIKVEETNSPSYSFMNKKQFNSVELLDENNKQTEYNDKNTVLMPLLISTAENSGNLISKQSSAYIYLRNSKEKFISYLICSRIADIFEKSSYGLETDTYATKIANGEMVNNDKNNKVVFSEIKNLPLFYVIRNGETTIKTPVIKGYDINASNNRIWLTKTIHSNNLITDVKLARIQTINGMTNNMICDGLSIASKQDGDKAKIMTVTFNHITAERYEYKIEDIVYDYACRNYPKDQGQSSFEFGGTKFNAAYAKADGKVNIVVTSDTFGSIKNHIMKFTYTLDSTYLDKIANKNSHVSKPLTYEAYILSRDGGQDKTVLHVNGGDQNRSKSVQTLTEITIDQDKKKYALRFAPEDLNFKQISSTDIAAT